MQRLTKELEKKENDILALKDGSPALSFQIKQAAKREAEQDAKIRQLGMILQKFDKTYFFLFFTKNFIIKFL